MDYNQASDELLISLMAHGEKEAISVLYDRYARLVFSLARAILRDRMLAEEVTQDTFFNAWRGAAGFRVEQGRVSTWLSAIARHRAIDELRRRHLPVLNIEEPWWETMAGNPSSASDEEGILLMQIGTALSDLPREQREAISLAYFGGLTQEEIAERLQEPLGTVKTRIRLGLKKLRAAVQKE